MADTDTTTTAAVTDTAATTTTDAAAASAATTSAAKTTDAAATDAAKSATSSTSTTDTKAADAAVTSVPETYTLALPKDSPLDAGIVERTAATARTLGLSNEAAQKVLETTHAEVQQFLTAEHAAFEAKAAEWKNAVLADPRYGKTPDERTAAIDKGRQLIDVHFAKVDPDGAAALKGFLDASMYGNHPAVVSLMHWLGQQGAEGPLVLGAPSDGKPKSDAEIFYGPKGVREKETATA